MQITIEQLKEVVAETKRRIERGDKDDRLILPKHERIVALAFVIWAQEMGLDENSAPNE